MRFSTFSRVCFIGDSITAAAGYTEHITQFYSDYLKSSGVRFYKGCVPGGTTASQYIFFNDDIAVYKPDHAVVMLGVNDSDRDQLSKSRDDKSRYTILFDCYENFKANLNRLLDRLDAEGITVTLCTPTPYAEYQSGDSPALAGGAALMTAYAAYVRSVALERGYDLCDIHTRMTQAMQYEILFNDDRLHPNELGHAYIAKFILEFLGFTNFEPKPFSEDVKNRIAVRDKLNCIYATELMILRLERYGLSNKEKFDYIKKYLENGRYPDNYFKGLAEKYQSLKENQALYYKEYIDLTDKIADVHID